MPSVGEWQHFCCLGDGCCSVVSIAMNSVMVPPFNWPNIIGLYHFGLVMVRSIWFVLRLSLNYATKVKLAHSTLIIASFSKRKSWFYQLRNYRIELIVESYNRRIWCDESKWDSQADLIICCALIYCVLGWRLRWRCLYATTNDNQWLRQSQLWETFPVILWI